MLGPLELWSAGRRRPLGTAKQRCVLAVLICAEREPVSVDVLQRRLWDGDPPQSAAESLQSYISRLRSRLRSAVGDRVAIEFSARTYRLDVDPEAVDLFRFRRLHRQGMAVAESGSPERAVDLLAEAEKLWRGEPLGEFRGHWAATLRERLREERRRAREARVGLELRLGRHADLVGELREMVAQHPVAEPAATHLMLALYRCGRHAESLLVYRRTRERLRDELGLSPSQELEDLHSRILQRDASLLAPELSRPAGNGPPAPDTMVRDIADFTGRDDELRKLLDGVRRRETALPLFVVHGMPGVGKTTLAVHAAHLLRERFPDGFLYVDLRAHSPHGQPPRSAFDALAALLQAMGDAGKLPPTPDERAARWRELLAHRRVLLVLDDARDAAQVRPLLPGVPSCCVIVTSRHRLANLEGAQSIALGVPSAAEAAALFIRIVGESRASDTAAVLDVVNLCGHHPLAIQLTASRFRHRDAWEVRDVADRLAQVGEPLEEIDAQPGIAAAFDLSYEELDENRKILFRLLALHPGPDLTLHAVAALAGADLTSVRRGMDELLETHLIEEPVRDRYALHSLVRAFAARVERRDDSDATRREAVERLLGYYLSMADAAVRLAHPQRTPPSAPRIKDLVFGPRPGNQDDAEAWLDMERANLLAVARLAAAGSTIHARYFPLVLAEAFRTWGVWETAAELHETALTIWRETGERPVLARILVERTEVLWRLGLRDDALRCVTEAMTLYEEEGDRWGQGEARAQRALVDVVSGYFSSALGHFDQALELHRQVGNHRGEAEVLNQQAVALAYMGRRQEALRQFLTALALLRTIGDRRGELKALNNVGEIQSLLGRHEESRAYYMQALVLVRRIGGRQELAILYNNLGNLCRAQRDTDSALEYFRKALSIYRAIRDLRCEADALINIGLTYNAAERYSEAAIHFTLAESVAQRIGDQYQRQRAVAGAAAAQRGSGRHRAARGAYEEALRIARAINALPEEAQAAEGLGMTLFAVEGQESDGARHYLRVALEIYERLGVAPAEADAALRNLAAHRVGFPELGGAPSVSVGREPGTY
ncbi:tetratricopeptide repeat protein [Streptomyces sp. KM273126]|nr:tetratricopeptide repeat protein [Streptomyces sp. KM273126]